MHILFGPEILAGAHHVSSGAPAVLAALNTFLIDDSHFVEVILSEVEVFPRLSFHFSAHIVVEGQLLYLETVFVLDFVSHTPILLLLPPRLLVRERDLRVALVRRHFHSVLELLMLSHV